MTNTVEAFTPSQQKALRLLKAGKNVFLTGKAGTGKSFLTREFIKMNSDKNMLICAPTGIAALNIGGSTIHRAFGVPIGIIEPKKFCQSKEKMEAIDKAEIVLIDEISKCRTDLFGFVARTILASKRKKQIVCVGDFYQLPPVLTDDDAEAYKQLYGDSLYAFQSPYWKKMNMQTIELQEVVRQKERTFISGIFKSVSNRLYSFWRIISISSAASVQVSQCIPSWEYISFSIRSNTSSLSMATTSWNLLL